MIRGFAFLSFALAKSFAIALRYFAAVLDHLVIASSRLSHNGHYQEGELSTHEEQCSSGKKAGASLDEGNRTSGIHIGPFATQTNPCNLGCCAISRPSSYGEVW